MLRLTLSLTFVALGRVLQHPHTGCNDAAPEVVEALTVEQGYAAHQFKSCGDIAAARLRAAVLRWRSCGCVTVRQLPLRVMRSHPWRLTDENDVW